MRKSLRRLKTGILVLLVLCGNRGFQIRAEETKKEGELRCISFYSKVNGLNSTIFQVTQSILDHTGDSPAISLSVYCLSTDLYESFEYKVQTAIALDMDVIILANVPEKMDESILRELMENKIFVLVVDGQLPDYEYGACIGTDNKGAGKQAADIISEMDGVQTAGIIATSFRENDISVSRENRKKGFIQEAEQYQRLKVLPERVCTADNLKAIESVRAYLEEYPELSVLYCLDSSSGVTASKVLNEQEKKEDYYVICFDNTEQIQEEMHQGGIDAVIVQDTETIGKECAGFLKEMAEKTDLKEFCQREIAIPYRIITAKELGEGERE